MIDNHLICITKINFLIEILIEIYSQLQPHYKTPTPIIKAQDHTTQSLKQHKITPLLKMVQTCVMENQEMVLLLEDHHMENEHLYGLVTGFVCEADVSQLYSTDEYEAVISSLKEQCSIDNYQNQPLQYLAMSWFYIDNESYNEMNK